MIRLEIYSSAVVTSLSNSPTKPGCWGRYRLTWVSLSLPEQISGSPSNPHADIEYHDEYDGTTYTGDRTAEVFVNPENPSESVYIKGISKPNHGGLAVAIGLVLTGRIVFCISCIPQPD